ncbi:adaptin N terminal region-domain-containing protein [Cantharellus anzutake]|uniref:adaptin N terminal region-domain-containing protein n=1 Tax=Cantharellus anzutake TaxID=1750568 RepID=UPI0019055B98|nr:adaptin N terminal region-domain-containing protein [Cantharellus anzutake]KAF8331867.1 adaptin N terminal region-domain-containing protein [Cantharellus anzutake]
MNGFGARAAPKKGENFELRADLNSEYRDRRKDAIKRVIANMTVGKDVSGLFPDVLKNMQTEDLEQKKLVYLYLMNYAKTQPELVILAVNTFVKDSDDPNPLVRALAIRTMGCLRAEKIIDYLSDPLHKALKDENPYVRKTAALCVAKLYDIKPDLAIDGGFLEMLQELIADSNPMVVSNAVTALSDIHSSASAQISEGVAPDSRAMFIINSAVLTKLLIALNECSEWGRVAILNCLAKYKAQDDKESEHICERVMPQFQHANGSVVLTAVRAVMVHMRMVTREDLISQLVRKMAPPLVTLVSAEHEVQWVALRNINLLLQKRSDILQNEMRVFFCKYNDPPYIKVEKLDIMIRLAQEKTVDTLLSELKEYASEVDVDFVRKSVRAIGQCAIKIDTSAERCVNVLLDLIGTRVSYVVQEAVVVMKDIFRKYPNSYEAVIPTLCGNLEELDEPEAKASLIWIIGEYADKIDNADELLGIFVDGFIDESYQVQLQTLTAVVKLFLKKPDNAQGLVQRILETATKDCESADVRDRAYIYWRLLSTDPGAAKAVVLASKPPITLPRTTVSSVVLEELLGEIGSLASVYHKPAETFVGRGRIGADALRRTSDLEDEMSSREKALKTLVAGQQAENLLDFDEPDSDSANASLSGIAATQRTLPLTTAATTSILTSANPLDELVSIFGNTNISAPSNVLPTTLSSPMSPSTNSNTSIGLFGPPLQTPSQSSKPIGKPQEDLLGLF